MCVYSNMSNFDPFKILWTKPFFESIKSSTKLRFGFYFECKLSSSISLFLSKLHSELKLNFLTLHPTWYKCPRFLFEHLFPLKTQFHWLSHSISQRIEVHLSFNDCLHGITDNQGRGYYYVI